MPPSIGPLLFATTKLRRGLPSGHDGQDIVGRHILRSPEPARKDTTKVRLWFQLVKKKKFVFGVCAFCLFFACCTMLKFHRPCQGCLMVPDRFSPTTCFFCLLLQEASL